MAYSSIAFPFCLFAPSICLMLLLPVVVVHSGFGLSYNPTLLDGMKDPLPRFPDLPLPPSESLPPKLANVTRECLFYSFAMNTVYGQVPKWALLAFFQCEKFYGNWCRASSALALQPDSEMWIAHAPTGMWSIVALRNRTAAECNIYASSSMPMMMPPLFGNLRGVKRNAAFQPENDNKQNSIWEIAAEETKHGRLGKLLPDPHYPAGDVPRKFAKRLPTNCKMYNYEYNALFGALTDQQVLDVWQCQSFSDNWCLRLDNGIVQQWMRRSHNGFYTLGGFYDKYDFCAI